MWQWESPGPEGCLSHCQSPKEEKEVGGTSEMGEAYEVNKICQELCLGSERRKCQQHKKYINMHPYININRNIHQHICICSSRSFLRQRKARSTNKMHDLLALSSPLSCEQSLLSRLNMCWSSKQNSLSELSFMSSFFLWIYMLEKKAFTLGITEDEQIEMLRPAHSFQEIQSSNNWNPLIVWSLVRQRPHQTIQRQKDMSAAPALIEPLTNPWISQQGEQSKWWFGLILVLVLHLCTWIFPKGRRDVPLGKSRWRDYK